MVLAGFPGLRQRGAKPLFLFWIIGLPSNNGINHILPVLYAPSTRPEFRMNLSLEVDIRELPVTHFYEIEYRNSFYFKIETDR